MTAHNSGDAIAQPIGLSLVDSEAEAPTLLFWVDEVGDRIVDEAGNSIVFQD